MRVFHSSILVVAALAIATHAAAQDGMFGSPAMLPLPTSVAPPASTPYLQPAYPPGIGQPVYQPYVVQQPVYVPVMAPQPVYMPAPVQIAPQQTAPQAMPQSAGVAPARYEYSGLMNDGGVLPTPAQQGAAPQTSYFEEALASPSGSCNPCGGCVPCCRDKWFGAVGGLILTRNNPNPVWTTAAVNNNQNQLMNTVDAMDSWRGGGLLRFGCRPCCGVAWDFTWWSIAPFQATAFQRDPGNLLTPIDLFGVNIGGQPATAFFDNAQEHRIWRRDTINNFEWNVYSTPMTLPGRPLTLTWLTGIRYFQFNEGLIFGSAAGGSEFGQNGGQNEAYIDSQVRNRLLGAQVGTMANCFFRPRLSWFGIPKFGIYNNWAHQEFSVYRGDGLQSYVVNSNQNMVSFIGEFWTGLNWAITPRCSLFGGYMVMAASGLALADTQYPHFLVDTPEVTHIKANNTLILHGAMFGLQFVF